MKAIFFTLLLLAALGSLGWTISRLVRFMLVGRPDIKLDRLGERLVSVIEYWLLQRKVPERTQDWAPRGFTSKHHLIIFWGFLLITIGTVEMWLNGMTGLDFSFLPAALYHPLRWVIDVFNLLVLFAVGFGFFRRIVVKPRLIP